MEFPVLGGDFSSTLNENYIRRNELVDNLTTNDAKKPLSAKQGQILDESKLNNVLEGGDGVTDLEHAQLIAIGEDVGRVYPSGLTWFQVDRKLGLLVGMTGTPYVVKKEKNKASSIVRILTENDNAPSASKLLTPRKINTIWSEWRVVGTRDDSKLPLAGGTLTGHITIDTAEAQIRHKPSNSYLFINSTGWGV